MKSRKSTPIQTNPVTTTTLAGNAGMAALERNIPAMSVANNNHVPVHTDLAAQDPGMKNEAKRLPTYA